MVSIIVNKQLRKMLSDFFSTLAPSLYDVLDFHCNKQTGVGFAEAIIKNPRQAYEFLVRFFGSETAVDILDFLLGNYLKRCNIQAYGILKNLKNKDNTKLVEVAATYSRVMKNENDKNRN